MTQTLIDPRMFDTGTALPAMDGSSLTSVGDMVLLATVNASAAATVDLTAFDNATYSNYTITIENWICSSATQVCHMRFSTDGGSTFLTTGEYEWQLGGAENTTWLTQQATGDDWFDLNNITSDTGNGTDGGFCCVVDILGAGSATQNTRFESRGGVYRNGTTRYTAYVSGRAVTAQDTDAVRLLTDAGNSTGTFKLYGRK